MADPSPTLPPTPTTDRSAYAPFAPLAIAAFGIAAVSVGLVVLVLVALLSGQRIFYPMLLVGPAVALVLAFAGRRQVINSEGARDGLRLCTLAWWMAISAGLGYATYLYGIQWTIQKRAAGGMEGWAKNLKDVDTSDPKNLGFFRAFVGTLDPEKQANYKPSLPDEIWKTSKTQAVGIRQSDVIQLANRNRDALRVEVGGLEMWEQEPTGLNCKIAVTFKSPEGEFSAKFPLTGRNVEGTDRWAIGVNPAGNFTSGRVTRYGQKLRDISISGGVFVYEAFVPVVLFADHEKSTVFDEFAQPARRQYPFEGRAFARMAGFGAAAYQRPEPADYADRLGKSFQPVDRGDPAREAEQRRVFVQTWKAGRFGQPRRFLQNNPETDPMLFVHPDHLEQRVPVEVQPPGIEAASAARAHVVLRLDDPAVMDELNKLRSEAAGDSLAELQTRILPAASVPWKVVRVESDMKLVQERQPQQSQMGMGG